MKKCMFVILYILCFFVVVIGGIDNGECNRFWFDVCWFWFNDFGKDIVGNCWFLNKKKIFIN